MKWSTLIPICFLVIACDSSSEDHTGELNQACQAGACIGDLLCIDDVCRASCSNSCGGFGQCVVIDSVDSCQCQEETALTIDGICAPRAVTDCDFENACIETYRTQCHTYLEQSTCVCDMGYIQTDSGACIPDPQGLCADEPCVDEYQRNYCAVEDNQFVCKCGPDMYEDYYGECQPTDPCHPHQCFEDNKGTCVVVGVDQYECQCDPAFTLNTNTNTCEADYPSGECDLAHMEGDEFEPDECSPMATALSFSQEQAHTVLPPDDRDWYSFTAQAGSVYTVTMENVYPLTYSTVSFVASNGTTLLDSSDCEYGTYELSYEFSTAGTYYIVAEGCVNKFGPYEITLTDSGPDDHSSLIGSATILSDGVTTNGVIGTKSDIDMFRINADAHHAYNVDLQNTDLFGTKITVMDYLSTELFSVDCNSDHEPFTYKFDENMPYYFKVEWCFGTGNYTITVTDQGEDLEGDQVSNAVTLTEAAYYNGRVDALNDIDWFTMATTDQSQYYQIDFAYGLDLDCAFFTINDQDGSSEIYRSSNLAAYAIEDFVWRFDTLANTTYSLMVRSCDQDVGDYTLYFEQLLQENDLHTDEAGTSATSVSVNGAAVEGTIQAYNDIDMFKVNLNAGSTYQLDLQLNTGSYDLSHGKASVISTSSNTQCQTEDPEPVTITPSETATYLIQVQGCNGGLGTYSIAVTQ